VSVRIAVLVALVLLAGCGGDNRPAQSTERHAQQASEESRGEEEEKGGLESIAAADRHAFVQIATAAGDLNTGASVLLVHGAARPEDTRALRRLLPLVGGLEPRDPRLRLLRTQVLHDLRRAVRLRAKHPGEQAARRMLADAAGIRAGLKRYANAKPAIGGVAPD
jgi:hypothetical protein